MLWGVRLLLVEDDEAIAAPLAEGLERQGFEVTHVRLGAAALRAAPAAELILLDLGLPDQDGLAVCRQIRATSPVPIIIVTARADEVDRVVGLELGADDYMIKPFGLRELVARIRAVTRRTAPPTAPPAAQHIGSLAVDRRTHRVTLLGADVPLTPKEFALLALLAEDAGAVVSRHDILAEVWDAHWYGPTRTLDVHVAALRKKLGDQRWVETVRGVGFRLGQPS